MKTNDEIREEWRRIDNDDIRRVCDILREHENRAQDYLVDIVAALCGVTVEEMFAATNVARLTHARWLFWYASRYRSTASYDAIARRSERYGHAYDLKTVQNAVNKMSAMIDTTVEWGRRWEVVRRIINLRDEGRPEERDTIVIHVPRALKDKLNIEIKEK